MLPKVCLNFHQANNLKQGLKATANQNAKFPISIEYSSVVRFFSFDPYIPAVHFGTMNFPDMPPAF